MTKKRILEEGVEKEKLYCHRVEGGALVWRKKEAVEKSWERERNYEVVGGES